MTPKRKHDQTTLQLPQQKRAFQSRGLQLLSCTPGNEVYYTHRPKSARPDCLRSSGVISLTQGRGYGSVSCPLQLDRLPGSLYFVIGSTGAEIKRVHAKVSFFLPPLPPPPPEPHHTDTHSFILAGWSLKNIQQQNRGEKGERKREEKKRPTFKLNAP